MSAAPRRYKTDSGTVTAWPGLDTIWRVYDTNDIFCGFARKEGDVWVGYADRNAMDRGGSWVDGRTLEYVTLMLAGEIPEKRAA
jgi:hypothetical protein